MSCPLNGNETGERYSPPNVAVAFAFQMHDDVRMLYSFAHLKTQDSFMRQLAILEARIAACRERLETEKS